MPAGRPKLYQDKAPLIRKLLTEGKTVRQIEKLTGIPKSTVNRLGNEMKAKAEDFI